MSSQIIEVKLGKCSIEPSTRCTMFTKSYTTYTLFFRIDQQQHSFTSRYSVLSKLHNKLVKTKQFKKAFNKDLPKFPPKNVFTDFGKAKNYEKRAKQILNYFKILISNHLLITNKIFHEMIKLPPNLEPKMKAIARGNHNSKVTAFQQISKRKVFNKSNYNKKYHTMSSIHDNEKKTNIDDDISRYIHSLSQIMNQQRQKGVNLLLRIFKNIINNPTNPKYIKLNNTKISKKLEKCEVCKHLLFCCGFKVSGNKSLFDTSKLDVLKSTYRRLLPLKSQITAVKVKRASMKYQITDNNDNPNTADIKELIDDGVDNDEIIKAMNMSYQSNGVQINQIYEDIGCYDDKIRLSLNSMLNKPITTESLAVQDVNNNNSSCCIQTCSDLANLLNLIEKYNKGSNVDYDSNISSILNNFTHLLSYHESSDEFSFIHSKFNKCNIDKCQIMHRYYKERRLYAKNISQNNILTRLYDQIMDKIHNHYMHTYDIGYRLKPIDEQKLRCLYQRNDIDDDEKINNDTLAVELKKITTKANLKHKKFVDNKNKFSNQLSSENQVANVEKYSFGQSFYYWSWYKTTIEPDRQNPRVYYKNWSVDKYYNNLRDELLHHCISMGEYQLEYKKAVRKRDEIYCRKIHALPLERATSNNTILWGIPRYYPVKLEHLIAIIFYCGYTNLAYAFSKSFRRDKTETDDEFKERHRKYYHLAKCIVEVVNVYAKSNMFDNIKTFYHGVSKEMLFDSMNCFMFQPFSTTTDFVVAKSFTNNTGIIVELSCLQSSAYFSCRWISAFPSENELLFNRCTYRLKFENIINPLDEKDCTLFIQAIFIIDSITISKQAQTGDFMSINKEKLDEIREEIKNSGKKPNLLQVFAGQSSREKPIPSVLKLLTLQLIKHELSRYPPTNYQSCKYLEKYPYIKKLLHNICIKKWRIQFSWKMMNESMLDGMTGVKNSCRGWKFLSHLLCKQNIKMMNVEILCLLFPNVKLIVVDELQSISDECVEYILQFISKNRLTKIDEFRLSTLDMQNMMKTRLQDMQKLYEDCDASNIHEAMDQESVMDIMKCAVGVDGTAVNNIVSKYQFVFQAKGWFLANINNNVLQIKKQFSRSILLI